MADRIDGEMTKMSDQSIHLQDHVTIIFLSVAVPQSQLAGLSVSLLTYNSRGWLLDSKILSNHQLH